MLILTYGPEHETLVLIAYAKMPPLDDYTDIQYSC